MMSKPPLHPLGFRRKRPIGAVDQLDRNRLKDFENKGGAGHSLLINQPRHTSAREIKDRLRIIIERIGDLLVLLATCDQPAKPGKKRCNRSVSPLASFMQGLAE
jgi:hypothetical protein